MVVVLSPITLTCRPAARTFSCKTINMTSHMISHMVSHMSTSQLDYYLICDNALYGLYMYKSRMITFGNNASSSACSVDKVV